MDSEQVKYIKCIGKLITMLGITRDENKFSRRKQYFNGTFS